MFYRALLGFPDRWRFILSYSYYSWNRYLVWSLALRRIYMTRQEGISLLANDLIEYSANYNQFKFGAITDCHTECCMAGLCYIRKFNKTGRGLDLLTKRIEKNTYLVTDALAYGKSQLRLSESRTLGILPLIFASALHWPADLYSLYLSEDRVLSALYALQRMLPDGSISYQPNEVLNPLPQIKRYKANLDRRKRYHANKESVKH
jgi:hypothetical protein